MGLVKNIILFSSIILTVVLFFIDLRIELGVAFGVTYLIPVLLLYFYNNKKYVLYAAIITSVLTIIGFFASPNGGELFKIIFNRALSIIVIWSAYFMINRILIIEDKKSRLDERIKRKESLLKEIHHRIKNNLQIVNSLISLQESKLHDNDLKEVLKTTIRRIDTISVLHEKLYSNNSFSEIDLNEYLNSIVSISTDNIDEKIDVKTNFENIIIDSELANPLGLILSEIISNSVKHAFYKNDNPIINISLRKFENQIKLICEDNGIGFKEEDASENLGANLIKSLTKQLKGQYLLTSNINKGTKYEFLIPLISKENSSV